MRLPYVGSGVGASALAMDKLASKGVFEAMGLPTAAFCSIHRRVDETNLSSKLDQIVQSLGERLVIKPTHQGSALGVTRISTAGALSSAVQDALVYGDTLLIEQWIEGREMTVGVLDTKGTCMAFPVIEIQTPEASWYDFNHRYTEGASTHLMPAPISAPKQRNCKAQRSKLIKRWAAVIYLGPTLLSQRIPLSCSKSTRCLV